MHLTIFVAWSSLIFCWRLRVARIGSYLGHYLDIIGMADIVDRRWVFGDEKRVS